MRRRHRRVLFNVFAFSLLGIAVYLNMFRMNKENLLSSKNPARMKTMTKQAEKNNSLSKITAKENRLTQP